MARESSVAHLLELGYVDPVEIARASQAEREARETDLRQASNLIADGKLQEGIRALEKLVEGDAEWMAVRRALANAYYQAGQYSEARGQLDELVYHGVESANLAMLAGVIALHKRELPLAIDQLRYARGLDGQLTGVSTLLGQAYLRHGELDAAEDAFQEGVEEQSEEARALAGLAQVALRKRDFETAATKALEALDLDMHLAAAHYYLGVALVHLDRFDAAVQAFETATRVDPSIVAPYRWLNRITAEDRAVASAHREKGRQRIHQRREARRGE